MKNLKSLKNLSHSIGAVKSFVTANSPVLLVGASVTGVVTTGVLSAKAGYEARGKVEEKQHPDVDFSKPPVELTLQEKTKLTAPLYIAPVLSGAGTMVGIVGIHKIHNKRNAALAGLYAVASSRMDDYQEKAEELLGVKKTQEMQNDVGQRTVDRGSYDANQVIITGRGDELCYDALTDRYFLSSVVEIERAFNKMNDLLIKDGSASLNDYYDYVGLKTIPMGEEMGWSGNTVEPRFAGVVTTDGRSAVSVSFLKGPQTGYDRHTRP